MGCKKSEWSGRDALPQATTTNNSKSVWKEEKEGWNGKKGREGNVEKEVKVVEEEGEGKGE